MISAVDSSILLDVLIGDSRYADSSEACLRRAMAEGKLVIGECVLAEISPAFEEEAILWEFISDWRIEFVPSSLPSAALAGRSFARYLERGGRPGRVPPDFLIGAHARTHADRLLARDRGYLRDYFTGLTVIA